MKRTAMITTVVVFAAVSPVRAETAREIIQHFENQKLMALQEYLRANADAPDAMAATEAVIRGLIELGREQEAIPLLLKKYDSDARQPNVELATLFREVIAPLAQLYARAGQRDAGLVFLDRVQKQFADHADAARVTQAVSHFKELLGGPQIGERMEIKFTATDKREVDLAAMKGKVVLVDFWASWCGPCAREMQAVISAYEKYNTRGFEIIGISLDEERADMDKFIQARNMPWPQYFDGKGWGNELARRYGVTSIPATFLIGKDGKIAAKDLRGSQLSAKIEELLAAE